MDGVDLMDAGDLPLGKTLGLTLRGDTISSEEYTSADFMQREMDMVWAKVWNVGGLASEIPEPGDYITHQLGKESILMVRQDDGAVKAFFNVCQHRGNRLVYGDDGSADLFTCVYHGWQFARDGELVNVQDPEDFREGNPCGKLNLVGMPCEVWAGFIWYNMDPDCRPLAEFLGPVVDELAPYRIEGMTRVFYRVTEAPFNYKCIHDNFCESYHLPTLHPQIGSFVDDDYRNTAFMMYPQGHNLMKMKGALPSMREAGGIGDSLAAEMREWDLDPADFASRPREARGALQRQKRALGPLRDLPHFAELEDGQLTDAHHFNIFPGTTMTMSGPMMLGFQRAEPHPTDPNKCIFEHWRLAHPAPDGRDVVNSTGVFAFRVAEREVIPFGQGSMGSVSDQDLYACSGQQLGFQSRGFRRMYLAGQEDRVQQFHEMLHDYMDDRRP
ncbi:aromatic ring-hydroxylating dioxygenase subunit alpha [Emcibacter sp. SYSU 3D8]|uniref:aromatic ring-hydroxylating oxygenase subunit alpha n=1 Tax=Emcibacter sp. SYSU 3D8 TaxID=3133969 RepID=UPI0031FF172E